MIRQRILRYDTKKMIHKRKMGLLDFIRIKTFCPVKDTVLRMKRQATYCEKILENHISHKGLWIAKICKELSKFNNKKTT